MNTALLEQNEDLLPQNHTEALEDAGSPKESTTIHGNYIAGETEVHASQVAFRDINHHTVYNGYKAEFASLILKEESPYPEPVFTEALVDSVRHHRLLFIGNNPAFDKERYLRHLARRIKSGHPLPVLELRENNETDDILQAISRQEEPVIFLLPRMHPRQLGHDTQRVHHLARQKGHYIIISTEVPPESWEIHSSLVDDLWFSVPDKHIYSQDQLTAYLCTALAKQAPGIAWIEDNPAFTPDYKLAESMSLAEISQQYDSPEEIDLLVHMLASLAKAPDASRLAELVKEVTDSSDALVAKWFKTLSMRQQLITLAASMMEGMYDDQFFGIMKEAVLGFWEYRDPTLKCLDYCDLEFLMLFFEFEEIHEEKRLLRSRFTGQRTQLIRAAWSTHRRHILDMLPRLIELVMQSAKPHTFDFERLGTRDRRMVLRQTVSHTLSDLGLVHLPSVESPLMELSATSDRRMSRVASKALARWRELGHDQLLFDTLDRWQNDADVKSLVGELVRSQRLGQFNQRNYDDKAIEYIRASTVKVLGYAAEYDKPNQLSERLIEQLIRMARDSYPRVNAAICEALPRFIHHHIFQLRSVLTEHIMRIDDLDEPIASGLQLAYQDHPKDLVRTVEHWLDTVRDDASRKNRRHKMTIRDKMLATILAFWSKIDYDHQDPEKFSRNDVVETLHELYQQEGREELRQRILSTAITLLSQDWRMSGKYILTFFPPLDPDLSVFTSALYLSYVEERSLMTGGDCTVEVEGHYVSAWIEPSRRPLTLVEQMLYHWLERGDRDIQKLAALGLAVLSNKFELEERREVAEYLLYGQPPESVNQYQSYNPASSQRTQSPAHEEYIHVMPQIDTETDKFITKLMKKEPAALQDQVRMLYRYFTYRKATDKDLLGYLFTQWRTREDKNLREVAFYLRKIMVDPRPEKKPVLTQIIIWGTIGLTLLWLLSQCG
ncbi:hypothetical protein AB9P05_16610 [Roseivirga sp. BDSF3-8]|uniref:hypothetical protein n=1 Tax=Roseivirga sp. BDSF3-8 TaxID=3241598 RepID=UPI003531B139